MATGLTDQFLQDYPSHVTARHHDIGDAPIAKLIEWAERAGEFAYDLETGGLDPRKDRIEGVSIYVPPASKYPSLRAWYPFVDRTCEALLHFCHDCDFQTFRGETCNIKTVRKINYKFCPKCHSSQALGMEIVDIRPPMPFEETWDELQRLFQHEGLLSIAHHRKFDDSFVEIHTGYKILTRKADSMIADYASDEECKRYGLKPRTKARFGVTLTTYKEAQRQRQRSFAFMANDALTLGVYAMDDAEYSWKIYDAALNDMREQDPHGRLEKIYWKIDMPVSTIIQEMENTGVLIDWEHLVGQDDRLAAEQDEVFNRRIACLVEDWTKPFNPRSTRDKSDFLFNPVDEGGLGLPTTGLTRGKSGQWPTNEKDIKHLKYISEAVKDLLSWSSLETNRNNFTKKLIALAQNSSDGRIYSHFNQCATVIARLSSSNPVNLQNQPRKKGFIRQAYCSRLPKDPDSDLLLFGADFSQIELRVAAHLAQEQTMLAVYASSICKENPNAPGEPCDAFALGHECTERGCDWKGHAEKIATVSPPCPSCGGKLEWLNRCRHVDIHQRTADDVGVPRNLAKALNFGTLYRMGPYTFCVNASLFDEYGVPKIDYAREIMDGWMRVYKGIPRFHRSVIRQMEKDDHWISYTLTGRRRRLQIAKGYNEFKAGTQAIQFAISGTAQDIMKVSMIKVSNDRNKRTEFGGIAERKMWKRVKFLIQVHDEMILQGPEALDHEIREMMEVNMEGAVNPNSFSCPLVVEAKSGRTWDDIH